LTLVGSFWGKTQAVKITCTFIQEKYIGPMIASINVSKTSATLLRQQNISNAFTAAKHQQRFTGQTK